jgi:hypothetical protein
MTQVNNQLIPFPVPIPTLAIKKQFIITLIVVRVKVHMFRRRYA